MSERILLILALAAVLCCFPPLAPHHPWQDSFVTYVVAILLEAFPYVLLGAAIAAVVEALLPADLLPRLARRLGRAGVPGVIAMSPLLPVCECGVVPVVRGLMRKGLPLPHAAAFLVAAPVLNPTVLFTTWLAFQDLRYPLYRALGAVLVALAVAWFARRAAPTALVAVAEPACREDDEAHVHAMAAPITMSIAGAARAELAPAPALAAGFGSGVLAAAPVPSPRPRPGLPARIAAQAVEHFLEMSLYLIVGVLIAAALKTFFVPHLGLGVASGALAAPLFMMGMAFVLSLCAEADAFVAASFPEFSFAAQIAFLVFGPMFDVKLLLMYRSVFARRFIAGLAAVIALAVLAYAVALGALR